MSRVTFLRSLAFGLAALLPALAWADPADDDLWAGAQARIEKCRTAPITVAVVDAADRPLPGAKIALEQTRHAFLFGCNIFPWGHLPEEKLEAAYRRRFAELLNYATLAFYWPMYEPQQGSPRHQYTTEVARWCRDQGIATKGHPLAWNHADPAWLPADLQQIRKLQMARIDDCVARFQGLIDRWDVVNEVTQFDRKEFLHNSPKMTGMWQQAGQIEFPRECFRHARQAGPGATLLINDYITDSGYERVIEKLVDAQGRRLYDVIGIQSHQHSGAWSNRRIWEVCQRFARFGVPLHFTETTILSGARQWDKPQGGSWPTTPEGEAYQAREAARFYTMLFSHPAVQAITWWDFSDRQAWKGAPAGLVRGDMTPKPAYDALMKLIHGKWWTRASLDAGAAGTAEMRGFLGQYRVTVTAAGKKSVSREFTLSNDRPGRWVVRVE